MFEKTYVKDVYQKIASNFSKTRYVIWEDTRIFLDSLETGSQVLDVGCGNGKAMFYRKTELNFMGIDNCEDLVKICKDRGLSVQLGCITQLSFDDDTFDAVICIAVIHHLDTFERRRQAIHELLRVVKKNGEIFISLWCDIDKSIKTTSNDVISLEKNDYLVPWKLNGELFYRYYHFVDENELKCLFHGYSYSYFYKYGNYFVNITK